MNQQAEILMNVLSGNNPSEKLERMFESKELHSFLPEVSDLYSEDSGHKNNFVHTMRVLDNACAVSSDPWFRLAALLHDIGKARTKRQNEFGEWTFHGHEEVGAKMLPEIWKRLDLPEEHFELVEVITRQHGQAKNLGENVTDTAIRRFFRENKKHFEALIAFCKCDMTTRYKEKIVSQRAMLEDLRLKALQIEKHDIEQLYRIPLDGVWLMQQTGLPGGMWIKEITEEVKRAIKANELADEEIPAKEYAISLLKIKGLIK